MKTLYIIVAVILSSFFLFPFEFGFLPGINTKLMLTALGTLFMAWHMLKDGGMFISKEVGIASGFALVFSLICYFSVDYNNTTDMAYATYLLSMWIWLFAAYAVCTIIAHIHGYISPRLIMDYFIAVCVVQCGLAMIIEFNPLFKAFVDRFFVAGIDYLNEVDRLYGIGAALDVAGGRFSAVLLMIVILLAHDKQVRHNAMQIGIYSASFLVIGIIGNMIARSTSVGMLMALGYLILSTTIFSPKIKYANLRIWHMLLGSGFVLILAVAYLYNTNKDVYELLRYGFEGFFNWIEKGEWTTSSTERLKTMWVYPKQLKTWIIGDAYFTDPGDPSKFYMYTDVGYLRFIFYSGLLGLVSFSLYFVYLSAALWYRLPEIKALFLLLLVLTFVNWLKVSTDSFLIYAPFLAMLSPYLYNRYYKKTAA